MKKRVLAIVMAMVMVLACIPVSQAASELKTPVGMDVSKMNTKDLTGEEFSGEEFSKYQLTVLNIWAVWCTYCIAEMPHLQKLYEEYESLGVNVMGVFVEDSKSTVAGGINTIASKGLTYPTLMMDSVLMSLYHKGAAEAGGIPMSFLVDSNGVVLSATVGAFTSYTELENWILKYWKNPVLENISIPKTAEVGVNRMISLDAKLDPAYAIVDEITWVSSDENVATVSDGGLVTGVSTGTTTVTVTVKSQDVMLSASCEVTVKESEPLPTDIALYRATDKITEGHSYAIVAKYQGVYYLMAPEQTVDGRYRLRGALADAESMVILPTEDGNTEMVFTEIAAKNLWSFLPEDDGYAIFNAETNEFLSTVRANGIYRLNLKSKCDTTFDMEDGMLKVVTEGNFTAERRFLSFYEDKDKNFAPAFDLIDKDNALFNDVMLFERVSGTADDPDDPDDPKEDDKLPGDVNGNDKVDAGDATLVLRCVVGALKLSDEQIKLGDMNNSGKLDSGDASLILRQAVK